MKQQTLRSLPTTPSIPFDHVPKVLMMGNGIDRAFSRDGWPDAIKPAWTRDLAEDEIKGVDHVPSHLQPLLLMENGAGEHRKELADTLTALRPSAQETELLKRYLALPMDAVLTINESYVLEKAVAPGFQCKQGRRCKGRHTACAGQGKRATQQLHTYFSCREGTPPIWHIRGEAARPDSVVLDHLAYGRLLTRMQQYVPALISRHNLCAAKGRAMKMYSWVDYFMLSEIHMVGMEMALSECDLWWLVSCKRRYFPDRQIILYQPDIKPEVRLMAEAYGMIVDDDGFFGRYREYYALLCERLEKAQLPPVPLAAQCGST